MLSHTSYKAQWYQTWKENNPWLIPFSAAKSRCQNSNHEKFKNYGGRGIKFLLTKEQIKELWFRDKAFLLSKPSIDRKEVNGDYSFKNCQFIEHQFNSMKDKKLESISQYDRFGRLIKSWPSINSVRSKGFDVGNVSQALKFGWMHRGYYWRKTNALQE